MESAVSSEHRLPRSIACFMAYLTSNGSLYYSTNIMKPAIETINSCLQCSLNHLYEHFCIGFPFQNRIWPPGVTCMICCFGDARKYMRIIIILCAILCNYSSYACGYERASNKVHVNKAQRSWDLKSDFILSSGRHLPHDSFTDNKLMLY